ncbi:unnamed protein product [marine sediment metagenome]|uniref:Uncharacterized protein n=2 Tax=marine sediment metagenome TaxID=412755 RepID=X0ZAD0_9ZZZZ
MATDILFNFYEILVENVFGSVGLAIMAVAAIIVLILLITRNTAVFITYWMLFYLMVMGTLYIGAMGLVFMFIISAGIFFYNIIKLFMREG